MCILKRPCSNCPFRNDGAGVELRPGRIESIIASALSDDHECFVCHRTLDTEKQTCAGFLALMSKMDRLPVIARIGLHLGSITESDIAASAKLVIGQEDLDMAQIGKLTEKHQERMRKAREKKINQARRALNL